MFPTDTHNDVALLVVLPLALVTPVTTRTLRLRMLVERDRPRCGFTDDALCQSQRLLFDKVHDFHYGRQSERIARCQYEKQEQ